MIFYSLQTVVEFLSIFCCCSPSVISCWFLCSEFIPKMLYGIEIQILYRISDPGSKINFLSVFSSVVSLISAVICLIVAFLSAQKICNSFLSLLVDETFLPTESLVTYVFLWSHHFQYTLDTVACKKPRRLAVSEILKPAHLTLTIILWSKLLKSLILPIS